MKFIIRLVISAALLCGNAGLLSESYAISSPKVEQKLKEQTTQKNPRWSKAQRSRRNKRTLLRGRFFNISKPEELVLSGLLSVGFGAMLLLGASRGESRTFGDALESILLSVVGTISLTIGAIVALIGGVWWLFETFGN